MTPRTQTGLIPTSHKINMNRLASPEAVKVLPPRPPPERFRFKGTRSTSTGSKAKPKHSNSLKNSDVSKKQNTSKVSRPWDSHLVENNVYTQSSSEIEKKETSKRATNDFLRMSAKKRGQIQILESQLEDEIRKEQLYLVDPIESDSRYKDVEGSKGFRHWSLQKYLADFKTRFVSRIDAFHNDLSNNTESNSIQEDPCHVTQEFSNESTIELSSVTEVNGHHILQDVESAPEISDCWDILLSEQKERIQKRMHDIYLRKYKKLMNDGEKGEDKISATPTEILTKKMKGQYNCVAEDLIDAISNGLNLDLDCHIPELKGRSSLQEKCPHTSFVERKPEHPYSLPLSEDYKKSLNDCNNKESIKFSI